MSVYLVSRLFDIFLCWSIVTSQIFFCEAGYTYSNLSNVDCAADSLLCGLLVVCMH